MPVIKPDWGYLTLEAYPSADRLTWKLITYNLLKRYGGASAEAIPLDLLHANGHRAVIRVPADKLEFVQGGLNGEVDDRSVRIVKVSNFLPLLLAL